MPQQRPQIPDLAQGLDASILSSRVIAVRERIDSLIRGTMQLAEKLPSTNGELFPHGKEYEPIDAHRLVIICEEAEIRTRLLNQFAGRELRATGDAESAPLLTHHRFGKQPISSPQNKTAAEQHHPLPFFRHLHLIEAPAMSMPSASQQMVLTDMLQLADLVIIALPAGDPTSAGAWQHLASVQESEMEKIILIAGDDTANAVERIAALAREKLSREMPAFCLCGKHDQGFSALRDCVTSRLLASGKARRILDEAIARGEQTLRKIEDQIEALNRKIRQQHRFMDEVERGFAALRVSFSARLPGHIEAITSVFNSEATIAKQRLKKRLRPLPSITRLFTGGRVGIQMHSIFTERIQQAVMEIAAKDSDAIAATCQEHYQQLCERTKDELGIIADLPKDVGDTLSRARDHFLERIEHSAKRGITDLKFRNPLEKLLRRRNRALKSFVAVALTLTVLGASSGAMGIAWLAALLCMLAVLFVAGGLWAAWISRRSIVNDFAQRLNEASSSFAANLHSEYETAISTLLAEYATSLKPLRTHIDREKNAIDPLTRRWHELFLGFKALAQEL